MSKAEYAFDFRWLAAAERGAGVSRHQLDVLARVLEVQTNDIVLAADQRPPYRGLLSFEPEDAPLFGGRDLVVEDILKRLALHPMVGVYGASGSGKSSVVKAGVIARLRLQQNPIWRVLTLRPGIDPPLALARTLGSELDRDADEDTRIKKARERAEDLSTGKARLSDYFDAVVRLRAKTGVPERILMFVDQWEEVYTHAPEPLLETAQSDEPSKAEKSIAEPPSKPKDNRPTRRSVFLDQLLEVFSQRQHRMIFTMRADFMGRLLEDHLTFFEAVKPGMLPLPRMSHEELAEAIQKPGQATGLTFDEGLVTAVLEDAGNEPGVLALVEFALTQLWKQRDKERNRLTLQSYHAMSGLRGAIDRHAEAIFAQLSPPDQAAARRALTKLVHVSTLESYTRMRRLLSDMEGDEEKVLRHLADEESRLVVISYDEQQKSETVEVAHEALIREWKTLRGWVEQDPRFLQWREEVDKRRRRFERNGSKSEDMLQGYDLEEAKSWLLTRGSNVATVPGKGTAPTDADASNATMTHPLANILLSAHDIPPSISSFIEVSQKRQEILESEREAARVRDKRSSRQWRVAAFTLLVLGIGLATLGWFFNEARQNAEKQARLALSNETRTLAALAQIALNNKDLEEAVKLGLAAWPRSSTDGRPQLGSAIHVVSNILSEYKLPRLTLRHASWSTSGLMTPDGSILSWLHNSINIDGTLRLWNAETGEPIGRTMKHDDRVVGVLVRPDGRILSWSNDYTLRLWDAKTGEQIGKTMKHDGNVWGALVMPDGRILSWSWDSTLRVWDGKTGEQLANPMRHDGNVYGALVMPDGRILSWSSDGTLRMWNGKTGKQVGLILQSGVLSASLTPDGHILSSSRDNKLRLWDSTTGEQVGKTMQHDGFLHGALVMPDGRILSWSEDKTLCVWDGKTGEQVSKTALDVDFIRDALLMPDGHVLLRLRNILRLWNPNTGEQIGKTMQHDDFLNGALVMPDGRILSWSTDSTLRLWDGKTGEQVGEILQQGIGVLSASLMPDGRILSSSEDNALRLWDLNTGEQVGKTMQHGSSVYGALVTPDGRILSWSGPFSRDDALRIWDTRTGEQVGKTMQHGSSVYGALATPDGRILSWSGPFSRDYALRIWDTRTGEQVGRTIKHDDRVVGVLVMPDGRILSRSSDHTLRLWDAKTGEPIGKTMKHDGNVWGALVMPDGRILSWSEDRTLRLWDAATGELIGKPMQHDDGVGGALVMPDGRILLWSSSFRKHGTLRVWNGETREIVGKPMLHDSFVIGALVMPDGRILSWSEDRTLRLWDAATGELIGKPMQHDDGVVGALVMPDGRILSWSDDRTLRLWDAATGELIGKPMQHDDYVRGVLLTPNGHILSWSGKTLRLWDAETAQLIAKPMHHLSGVNGALVMPDSRLLSWSEDGTLRLWDIAWPKGNLFQVACALVGDHSLENVVQKYKLSVIAPICDHPERVPLPDWQSIE